MSREIIYVAIDFEISLQGKVGARQALRGWKVAIPVQATRWNGQQVVRATSNAKGMASEGTHYAGHPLLHLLLHAVQS